jgi:hypothetical protein
MSQTPGSGRIRELARARELHVDDRHAEPLGNFARQVGGDALGLARRALAADQQEIAQVDPGTQHAGRGKLGDHLLRRIGGHGSGPENGVALERSLDGRRRASFRFLTRRRRQLSTRAGMPARDRALRREAGE